ncbi:DNA mismatch repair protein MutT [Prolixibacter bellariivorans]|uniref:DNA mismatch repair protein MutT n=1 Tax=Prolixibacter bellariivorans TaxID=314319 RepID=A0A5M4B5R6_9BACT|nr:NUDIX domain-containing protein [Prolixibacter bellariivorans]GET35067.1 DNA mismatch repair protein MutT [Prolixibacter bellariivorans]
MPYSDKDMFHLAVDCVIFGFDGEHLNLLLYKRDFEPEKGSWSLMGGFLQKKETLDDAAYRVLARITGMRDIYMEQLSAFSEVDRDPAARVVSMAYYSLINIQDYREDLLKKHGAQWFSINEIPSLVFDHSEIVDKALRRLKRRAKYQPIGFELLPETFTITQLRLLYEAIYQEKLEPANFRRKIISMNLLDRLPIKDMSNSKKGAYLYAFNKERYEEYEASGYSFEL